LRARARPIAAAVACAALLAPLTFLVLGAFHAPGSAPPSGWDVVAFNPTLAAFERAFDAVPLGRQMLNSLLVVAVAVPVSLLVASWAGFALAQLPTPARRVAVGLVLVLLVVPASAVWVPRFVLLSDIGLVDSLVALMLPALAATTPFAVLLFYWAFRRLPRGLADAAQVEGLSAFATWRLLSPLVRPTTVAVGAIVFALNWGNFVDALLYLYSPEKYTLPIGSTQLRALGPTDVPTVLAGALVVALPPVVAFALVQRRFLQSLRSGRWLAH
jgi:multiple sugar transport system permease protein